jgi:hypothetical protein
MAVRRSGAAADGAKEIGLPIRTHMAGAAKYTNHALSGPSRVDGKCQQSDGTAVALARLTWRRPV